jgi:hypothetical protein
MPPLEFQDCEARHLMTPRGRVVGIPAHSSVEAALRSAREWGYSRFPVYAESLDRVEGVVHTRDLYEARDRGANLADLVQAAPSRSRPTGCASRRWLAGGSPASGSRTSRRPSPPEARYPLSPS